MEQFRAMPVLQLLQALQLMFRTAVQAPEINRLVPQLAEHGLHDVIPGAGW